MGIERKMKSGMKEREKYIQMYYVRNDRTDVRVCIDNMCTTICVTRQRAKWADKSPITSLQQSTETLR